MDGAWSTPRTPHRDANRWSQRWLLALWPWAALAAWLVYDPVRVLSPGRADLAAAASAVSLLTLALRRPGNGSDRRQGVADDLFWCLAANGCLTLILLGFAPQISRAA